MRVWFRAMHLLAQGKKGLSNIELGRRLGISTNAAWRIQHKLMQAMIERDRRYMLGAAGPRIEIDDADIGGERTGDGAGRGRRGHTPFIIAVETSSDGRPLHTRLQVVRGFQAGETKRLCARVVVGTTVVSDGGQWFRCIAEQRGIVHERHVTGSDRRAARYPAFRWANTMLANIKNSLLASHRVVAAKHLPRYLGAFAAEDVAASLNKIAFPPEGVVSQRSATFNPESTTDIVCLALRVETRRRVRRDHVGQCAAVFRSLVGRRWREPVPAARSPELVAKIRTAANPAAASAHPRCEPWPVRGAAPSTRQRLRSRQASGSWQKGLSHSARGGTQPGRVSRPPIHHEQ